MVTLEEYQLRGTPIITPIIADRKLIASSKTKLRAPIQTTLLNHQKVYKSCPIQFFYGGQYPEFHKN